MRFPGGRAYLDLAAVGRIGWFGSIAAILIAGILQVGAGLILVAVEHLTGRYGLAMAVAKGDAGILWQLALAGLAAAGFLVAAWIAVVLIQRRGFGTLLSPDGRLDPGRILRGATSYMLIVLPVTFLTIGIAAVVDPDGSPLPVWHPPGIAWIEALVVGLALIPIQAASEEFLFRGWLAQTLGRAIPSPWIGAIIVAAVFAAMHGLAGGWFGVPVLVAMSLLLSALILRDGRIELAIGVHAAHNLTILLVVTPFLVPPYEPHLFGGDDTVGPIELGLWLIQIVAIYALAFRLLPAAASASR